MQLEMWTWLLSFQLQFGDCLPSRITLIFVCVAFNSLHPVLEDLLQYKESAHVWEWNGRRDDRKNYADVTLLIFISIVQEYDGVFDRFNIRIYTYVSGVYDVIHCWAFSELFMVNLTATLYKVTS